ncbi:MAG: DUF3501 family protein [Alphaproteobacteria bacterium]|nr:DUF3501 family protein [Alphaproteobacteria bacterium]
MAKRHSVELADILDALAYEVIRHEKRTELMALKRRRRMEVGPFATFHFECWQTMWYQVQEMLRVERGGPAQVPGELEAYNPLVPHGRELVATVMFEIDDPLRRPAVLARLGGVEHTAFLRIGSQRVIGTADADADRTDEKGKASSVQFIRFSFSDADADDFRAPGTEIVIGFTHPNYGHMAVMPEDVRAALAEDFD